MPSSGQDSTLQGDHQAGVVIPVIGSRRAAQLQANLDCLKYPLTREQEQRLDAASRIALVFPHDFLASEEVRELVYGGMYAVIFARERYMQSNWLVRAKGVSHLSCVS